MVIPESKKSQFRQLHPQCPEMSANVRVSEISHQTVIPATQQSPPVPTVTPAPQPSFPRRRESKRHSGNNLTGEVTIMMSEINALWRRVRALQRIFARELAELPPGPHLRRPLRTLVRRLVRPQAPARNPALHQAGDGRRLPAPAVGRGQQLPGGLPAQR